ncbi:polar amino acid transport system substrate-binding protein [Rhodococcus rhodochrous J38]|uniref:ABC transporter substrate-binding protein n=1 Tax=Rhodococcus rhodochrous TaxID=1829 RepID=UPI0011A6301D|nr:ABC transporter substrate-binding protein [Rhodococcus rhodochrous]MCD2099259.1 ABC transporter substrate-binding protein [Rhodococcus rhodochrous]MCD2120562.1 ABC transporter substrate-binding protein [Rhodococcus rhodochrous]MCQ4136151.1 ABC transporter substrate-binding protein [Rhodococcus rhodochrous]MDJ0017427.1 ABC transporter substrate-binding protein [Rhodococcus rhodochrous]TWH61637.1 polar amino acid transport system substrate-binding protein [Rhodococcus rhodochrous J38]
MFASSRRVRLLTSALTAAALLGVAACGSGADAGTDADAATTAGYNLTADQNRITTDPVEEIAAKVPQEIRDRGTLVVTGSAGTAPPLRFYADDDTTIIGSETDFAHLIGNVLDLDIELTAADWAQNFVRVDSGEADVFISNVTVTEERKEKYDFATYRLDSLAIEVGKDSGITFDGPEDIAGLTIGVGSGTNQESLLVEWNEQNVAAGLEPAEILYYQNAVDYYLALGSGRIDAYVGPNPTSAFHVLQAGETEIAGTFSGAGLDLQGEIAVLTKKDNGLIRAINEAINHIIENGTYAEVLERWGISSEAIEVSRINPPGLPETT